MKFLLLVASLFLLIQSILADEVTVSSYDELKAAVAQGPGTTVLVAPGSYRHWYFSGIHGTEAAPIIIRAQDPNNRPIVEDTSGTGIMLSNCSWMTIDGVIVNGSYVDGINVSSSEGSTSPYPEMQTTHHIVIQNVLVNGVRPAGNNDGMRSVYVDHITFRRCRVNAWGDGGQAIDVLATRHGLIEQCEFYGTPGKVQNNAITLKRASTDITVCRSFFSDCSADQMMNLGMDDYAPGNWAAIDVLFAGNRMVGGGAPFLFASSSNVKVTQNTIVNPKKHLFRVQFDFDGQQDTISNNLFVFDASLPDFRQPPYSIQGGNSTGHFIIDGNAWFQIGGNPIDVPALLKQKVGAETNGLYGVDPKLSSLTAADMKITSDDPVFDSIGADAYWQDETGTTLTRLECQITNLLDRGSEILSGDGFDTKISVTYDPTTGILRLVGEDTLVAYERVLRTVRYDNTAASPSMEDRIISVTGWNGPRVTNTARSIVTPLKPNLSVSIDLDGNDSTGATGADCHVYWQVGHGPVPIGDADVRIIKTSE